MAARFGDLLALASENIDAAIADHSAMSPEVVPAVVHALARLTAVMVRCADAFVTYEQAGDIALLNARARAVWDARLNLRHAARRMGTAAAALQAGDGGCMPAAADWLLTSAACLSAAHDSLQTHFAPGPFGSRVGNSTWAPVIVSPKLHGALVAELAIQGRHLARWALGLTSEYSDDSLPIRSQVAIGEACQWLHAADASAWAAQADAGMNAARALLRAIPANVAPPRYRPYGSESVPGICVGLTATAERLRYLAHQTADRSHTAGTLAATAWQQTARARLSPVTAPN
jgi:hypothetical protein